MTTAEKIQLRDKARRDFEGKTYEGNVIDQVLIAYLKVSKTVLIQLFDVHGMSLYDFTLEDYDSVLSRCSKPFPKGGFSIRILDMKVHNMALFVSNHHNCGWSSDINNKNCPQVTIQELKDEAKRILEL